MPKIMLSEMVEYYTPEFRKLLGELGEIAQTMNVVEMVTPVNAAEERDTWLAKAAEGNYSNPEFRYNRELLAMVAKMEKPFGEVAMKMWGVRPRLSAESPSGVLQEIARRRCDEIKATIELAQHMLQGDDAKAGVALRTIYGQPTELTVTAAYDYARALALGKGRRQEDDESKRKARRELKDLIYDEVRMRQEFLWVAEQAGIAGTRPVEIDAAATVIDVRDKSSRGAVVVIPTGRQESGMRVLKLAGHEILCHWADSERAAQALPLLGSGALKPADETLYEGHATLTDYHIGMMMGDKAPLQQQPYYVIAMALAAQGMNFAQVASVLHEKIRETKKYDQTALNLTWKTCFRVFRGSAQASRKNAQAHYAFTKDRAYFEGRLLANQLHDQGLDSILRIATLSASDIELLQTEVAFERRTDDFAQMRPVLEGLVERMIGA